MNKFKLILISLVMTLAISSIAKASVDTVSLTTYKSGDTVNVYVKNNHNKNKAKVLLELQKNGKTISKCTVYLNKNQQTKKVFKLTSKGVYKVKYTFNSKSSYSVKLTK